MIEKKVSKGCPQESVLAPLLWNLIFDDLLSILMPEGITVFGYTDYGALVIEAESRVVVETITRHYTREGDPKHVPFLRGEDRSYGF